MLPFSRLADLLQIFVWILVIYELAYSFGPAPMVAASVDGRGSFRLAKIRGTLRRGLGAQSIVKFAPGTGLYLPKAAYRTRNVQFPIDVVFLDGESRIVAIEQPEPATKARGVGHKPKALIVLNRGEASGLVVGDIVRVAAVETPNGKA